MIFSDSACCTVDVTFLLEDMLYSGRSQDEAVREFDIVLSI
jgi:hypothetical protein